MVTCTSCNKQIAENEVFTHLDDSLCSDCYLGKDGGGPMGDQRLECRHCGQLNHRFAIRCTSCASQIREMGKIDVAAQGSSLKGALLVLASIVFVIGAIFLGDRGVAKMGVPGSIGLAIAGVFLGINGLLGTLYFRAMAFVVPVKGIVGFATGIVSLILGLLCLVLLI